MRKYGRKMLVLGLSVILLMTNTVNLCACHGSREKKSFEVPEQFDTSKNYEITFWAKNDTNKKQVEIYEKAIEDFESYYPNIHVNLRLYTDYTKIYNDVITNIATDTTPNVCITYPDHIATYLSGSNMVVPLDDLIEDKNYGLGGKEVLFDAPTKDEMVPQFLKECKVQGDTVGVPYMRSTEACYINKTYVEALGYSIPEELTWDFIWEVSEAATKKNADGTYVINGQKVMIPFIYKSTDNMMIHILKQKNAPYSNASGEVQIFSKETKEVLMELADHTKDGVFSTFKISGYPANFLNAGQCIFAIDSTAGATWMGSDAPLLDIDENNLVSFETVVKPIPQYDTSNPKMISQGPSLCIFNKEDSNEVLASWLFVQFMLTNEVQIAYSQTEGYIPVTLKAQNSVEYQEYLSKSGEDNELHYEVKIEAAKILLEHPENTFVTPVFNGSASLRQASGELIETTVKSVRRKKEIDDAFIDTLYSDTSSLYQLDQIEVVDGGKMDLGPLPPMAKKLIITLITTWILIIGYVIYQKLIKNKRKKQE